MKIDIPCRIGDEVWGVTRNTRCVKKSRVSEMFFVGEEMSLCIVARGVCRGQFGRDIFATEEEANRAAADEGRSKL